MSEPVPCPTCGTLLRLPEGAATVRCPSCKTVLAVESSTSQAPSAPAIPGVPSTPPAPAAPSAPPLPFGRPTKPARPIAAPPPAAPAPLPSRSAPAKRAKLVAEDPYVQPSEADAPPDEAARRREIRRELQELDEKEEAEREWFEELAGHCKQGRIALNLLTWGVRSYALAVMFQLISVAAGGFMMLAYSGLMGLLALAFGGMASLLFGVGFGFVLAGPQQGRHLGIMGLVVTIVHAIGAILQPGNLAIIAGIQGIDTGKPLWSDFLIIQDFTGLATDFPLLADHPARFLRGYNWSLPGIIVAAIEFSRIVIICMLTQNYAVAGKDPELGHESFKTVGRMFWVILLTASFRMATASTFDWAQFDDLWFKVGAGVHGSITFTCYFSFGIALLVQSRFMTDTIDLVDHRRLADKRERLDVV